MSDYCDQGEHECCDFDFINSDCDCGCHDEAHADRDTKQATVIKQYAMEDTDFMQQVHRISDAACAIATDAEGRVDLVLWMQALGHITKK